MNRNIFAVAFSLGAIAVLWVAAGFVGTNLLALVVTVAIGVVYVMGALELRQFRQATSTLAAALAAIPENLLTLGDWLDKLHPSLHNPVRLRIEGERTGLPGPVLTPYLVGLLVMLGMLGTFVGMVVTLHGAVFALESTTDIQAIRAALAAPVKGLGLAFGTSVAGVAASAMLGLMSAISRRERLLVAQLLDTKIATALRGFSLAHQRQETFKALQLQAHALPDVVDKLQTMMDQMERRSEQLNAYLLANQQGFHSEMKSTYVDLARSVEQSLKDTLLASAQVSGECLKPVVESAMAGIAQEARSMHARMIDTTQVQLDGLSARFSATATNVAETCLAAAASSERHYENLAGSLGLSLTAFTETFAQCSESLLVSLHQAFSSVQSDQASADLQRLEAWRQSLASTAAGLHGEWQQQGVQTLALQQQICTTLENTARDISAQTQKEASNTLNEVARLLSCSEELIRSRIDSEAAWLRQHGERTDQLTTLWRTELAALREEEARRGEAAVERLGDLQTALADHLTTLGAALEGPMTRLLQTASEAPQAAAEVIAQLRQEMTNGLARDNEVLEERGRIMATLNSLLDAINHASAEQRAAIDSLVASAGALLNSVSGQFAEQVCAESSRIADVAAQVTSSAVEVSSLSEAFGFSMQLFSEANEKLIASLQRIEAAMDKSMERSDEQLAYYVAQAREIIDLSMMSQKEVVEDLRQLNARQKLLADGVA